MKVDVRVPFPFCEECTRMLCKVEKEYTGPDGKRRDVPVWVVSCIYHDDCKYISKLMKGATNNAESDT